MLMRLAPSSVHCALGYDRALQGNRSGSPATEFQGMSVASVRDALAGRVSVGEKVTVRGWVRTRRDSKAGISFITVNDGSGQDSIQVVAPNSLANYDSEIVHLTAGCAVIATGTLVQSQGKGQSFEIQA